MTPLKYLFTAFFKDGTQFVQNPEDKSETIPGKSAYTDLCALGIENLKAFEIFDGSTRLGVNLETGFFNLNGREFAAHDHGEPLTNFRLIYFRDRWEHQHTNKERGTWYTNEIYFMVGWQANLPNGENIQRVITIA